MAFASLRAISTGTATAGIGGGDLRFMSSLLRSSDAAYCCYSSCLGKTRPFFCEGCFEETPLSDF